jgi:predicted acyltransferase
MLIVPVPGHGRGDLSKEHNLGAYVDTQVLGRHVWVKPPRDGPPGTLGWEPEGLLSTLPAIATTLLGLLTGQWLRTSRPAVDKAAGMLVLGVLGAALGYVLDRVLMPINKGLWTPSYVVYTAGLALLALGTCYWLIDVRDHRAWSKPAVIFGMNAIAVFVLSGLIGRLITVKLNDHGDTVKGLLYNNVYQPLGLSPVNTSLTYALTWITVMFLITWLMYRMRVFIKV